MAKNSFYIMNRKGSFKPTAISDNQCVMPYQPAYYYTVKLMFDGNQPLDHRQFLLDHKEVDSFIQKLGLVGSCEEMHVLLKQELPEFMAEKSLDFVCYKATISGTENPESSPAFLEFVWARNNRDLKCLGYL